MQIVSVVILSDQHYRRAHTYHDYFIIAQPVRQDLIISLLGDYSILHDAKPLLFLLDYSLHISSRIICVLPLDLFSSSSRITLEVFLPVLDEIMTNRFLSSPLFRARPALKLQILGVNSILSFDNRAKISTSTQGYFFSSGSKQR